MKKTDMAARRLSLSSRVTKRFALLRRLPLLILLIFIVGLCARVAFLDADPPSFISHFMENIDEGAKGYNARNFALYDQYIVDDFNEPIFSYPCYTVLLSMFLKVFGVHLVVIRLFSILCSSVMFWLIFRIMRREQFSGAEITLALLFYWISSFYLFLNRIGLVESLVFTWFLLMYDMIYLSRQRSWWAAAAGVFFTAAFFSKAIAVIILPAAAACLLWGASGFEPARVKNYVFFIIGAISTSVLAYLLVVQINPEEYVRFNESILNTGMFFNSFREFFPGLLTEYRDLFILAQFPLAAAFCISFFSGNLGRDVLKEKGFLVFVILWFFGALIFLSLIYYRPSRYYLLVVPATCILAGIGAGRFLAKTERGVSDYLYCAPIIIGILFFVLLPLRHVVTLGGTPGISLKLVAELSIAGGLCLWLIVFVFRLRRSLKPIVVAGIVCFLIFNTAVVYRAYSERRYETVRVTRFIEEMIGDRDALIAGRVEEYIFDSERYRGYIPFCVGRDLTVFSSNWTHVFEDKKAIPQHIKYLDQALKKYGVMERAVRIGSIKTDIMPDGKRHEYILYEIVK